MVWRRVGLRKSCCVVKRVREIGCVCIDALWSVKERWDGYKLQCYGM